VDTVFHFINTGRFFSTTARAFCDEYSNYRLIFSSLCKRLQYSWVDFFITNLDRVILTLVGFFCVISLCYFPDSFQITKGHSYDGYSIYLPSFNQFLPAIHPVGVTDLRSFLLKKLVIAP